MIMITPGCLTRFITDEGGGMSVEWVTLTAACMAIVLAAFAIVSTGIEDLVGETADIAGNMDIEPVFLDEEGVRALRPPAPN